MSGPGATNYVMINNFLIDCSISENHSFESDITDYPVESGSNVSDNIRPLPIQIEIEGLVSNTPIGPMVNIRALSSQFGSFLDLGTKPAEDAYELFMQIRDAREPITIQTSLRTYDNMAMQSLSIPKGDHQDALRFTAKFKQIISVENVRSIRVSTPIGKGKKTISGGPVPWPGRAILIDKKFEAWFDPDFNVWRKHAVFVTTDSSDIGKPEAQRRTHGRWNLFRGAVIPNLTGTPLTGAAVTNPNSNPLDVGSLAYTLSPYVQLFAASPNQYVTKGFTFRFAPGTSPGDKGLFAGGDFGLKGDLGGSAF